MVVVICTTNLNVVQSMYRPLRRYKTTLARTLCDVCALNVCHYARHDVTVIQGRFQNGRVNVNAHALNCKDQYLTLLQVYKGAACTCTLSMVIVICTTNLRDVQLIYITLRRFETTIGPTLCYMCLLNVCLYARHDLRIIQGIFQFFTVNVHAHALKCNQQYLTLLQVYKGAALTSTLHTVLVTCTTNFRVVQLLYRPLRRQETTLCSVCVFNVCDYARHDVSVMKGRIQTGTLNFHAYALNCNNQYLTLLYVYKGAAWTSTLNTVLIICTTNFMVVQSMYGPLRKFKTTIGQTIWIVCTRNVCHYAGMMLLSCREGFRLVGWMFMLTNLIATISTLNCLRGTKMLLGPVHFIRCQ